MEKSKIYLKVNGELQVYASDMKITHEQAVDLVKQVGVKPDGAILLIHI